MRILYDIPGLGPTEIRLRGPAEDLYRLLETRGEIERLKDLKHAGVQAHLLPAMAHHYSRMDCAATMMLAADRLVRPRRQPHFRLGQADLVDEYTAAQVLALLTTCGHIAGTYGVEKGVLQWLHATDRSIADLPWMTRAKHKALIEELHQVILQEGYVALHRALGAYKLDCYAPDDPALQQLLWDFYVPYLVGGSLRDPRQKEKWSKVEIAYETVRRVGFMNMDIGYSEVPVRFDLGEWLQRGQQQRDIEQVQDYTQDILGTLEHLVFRNLYLREESRIALAWATSTTFEALRTARDPFRVLDRWLSSSSVSAVVGTAPLPTVADLRSMWRIEYDCNDRHLPKIKTVVGWENDLRTHIKSARGVCIWEYVPWQRRKADDAPHMYATVLLQEPADLSTVALLLNAVASQHEPNWSLLPYSWMYVKGALSEIYEQLLARLLQLAIPGTAITLEHWDLPEILGMPDAGPAPRICAFASGPHLDDLALANLLAPRPLSDRTDSNMRGKAAEFSGVACLCQCLKRKARQASANAARIRHFVLTASVTVKKGMATKEFDGAIVCISPKDGSVLLYLLETKSGREAETIELLLQEKADALELRVLRIHRLDSHTGYIALWCGTADAWRKPWC